MAARLPPPLHPGSRVGVASLSGPVEPGRLARGLEVLEGLGFEPVLAANVGSNQGLFAGHDGERLEALYGLADDPSIAAIFFTRGGHGVLRVLPCIDWRRLAAHPRAYVGYSDLTPFLLEVVKHLDLVSFHGPMVGTELARGLGEEEEASLMGALCGELDARLPVRTLQGEPAGTGVLLGGCLSLLVSLLGTTFFPPLDGAFLFLEDTNEPLYRLDRMLTHLRLSGSLARIRGMLLGHFYGLDSSLGDAQEKQSESEEWLQLITEAVREYSWPLVCGLTAGHGSPNLTLPLGFPASFDRESSSLVLGPAARG